MESENWEQDDELESSGDEDACIVIDVDFLKEETKDDDEDWEEDDMILSNREHGQNWQEQLFQDDDEEEDWAWRPN